MLRITDDRAHCCLVLEPTGSLSRSDLDRLGERFDQVVKETGRAPNLVVHAASFPSWADLGALARHLRFIRRNHKRVGRVAFVSDARALDRASAFARRLVSAELRHFPESQLSDALAWVAEEADLPQVTLISGLPDDTVGISVAGVISADDYAGTITPIIEEAARRHGQAKLLYRIGPEFERFTSNRVCSDALTRLHHMTDFSRVAIVSDIGWIPLAVRALSPLIPAEVHMFADKEIETAKAWLSSEPPSA